MELQIICLVKKRNVDIMSILSILYFLKIKINYILLYHTFLFRWAKSVKYSTTILLEFSIQDTLDKNTLPKTANLPRRGCSTDQSLSDFIKIIFTFIILLIILLIFLSIITSGLRTIDLIQRNSQDRASGIFQLLFHALCKMIADIS